jgi:hypothetical protein
VAKFKVGVFHEDGKRRRRYRAYTTWFSPTWPGVRVFDVVADSGTHAKAVAIACAKLEDAKPRTPEGTEVKR